MVQNLSTRQKNPDKFLLHNSWCTGKNKNLPQGMKNPQKRDMSSEKLGLENSLLFHRFFLLYRQPKIVCFAAVIRVIKDVFHEEILIKVLAEINHIKATNLRKKIMNSRGKRRGGNPCPLTLF